MAPETIKSFESRKENDYWSLGVFIYHCLTGKSPFYSNDIDAIFKNIKSKAIRYPDYLSPASKELIQGLL